STLLLPTLLALLQGFLVRKKQAAYGLGMFLCLCLAPTFWEWMRPLGSEGDAWLASIVYALFGGSLAGGLGILGAKGREYYFVEEETMAPAIPDDRPERSQ